MGADTNAMTTTRANFQILTPARKKSPAAVINRISPVPKSGCRNTKATGAATTNALTQNGNSSGTLTSVAVGPDGKVMPYLLAARRRGIRFDTGHGAGSFCFRNAVPCVEQGFWPDSISTDLHTKCMNDARQDMTNVMSKLLVIGMPLCDVIRASTINPANEIGHPELGHLSVGAVADVTALNLMEGDFAYLDVRGGKLDANERFRCELTLCEGEVVWDWNGRTGVDWRELGDTYGVRNQEDGLILPSDQ